MKYAQVRSFDEPKREEDYPQPLTIDDATEIHGFKIKGEPSNSKAGTESVAQMSGVPLPPPIEEDYPQPQTFEKATDDHGWKVRNPKYVPKK